MNNGEAMMLRAYQDRAVAGDGDAYIVRDPSGEVRYLSPTAWQARLNSIEEQERPTAGEALTEAATEWPGLDVAKGAVRGAVTGIENITSAVNEAIPFPEAAGFHLRSGEVVNDVQGLMTWVTEAIKDNTGLDTRIEISEPETIPGMIAEGVALALPGIIPAVRAAKMGGAAPVVAETIGGFIGDYMTSSEDEGAALVELLKMVPDEDVEAFAVAVEEWINDPETGEPQDFESRVAGAIPGILMTPALMRGLAGLKNAKGRAIAGLAVPSMAAGDVAEGVE